TPPAAGGCASCSAATASRASAEGRRPAPSRRPKFAYIMSGATPRFRSMPISPITEIIEDIRHGRMAVLMDDADRENEGDVIIAAEHVTPEAINFMATHARGLICMPITRERARQLNLAPMVAVNRAPHGTNFTVSIEAAEGVTTGISAHDRAHTIRVAAAADARPDDIVQPGHVFPLVAEHGGVLA